VDAFIVVHAGKGAESTGSVNDIWSHKWVLPGSPFDADGTKIYAYLTVPEDSKIGVCCHELGHLLFGFPDLYDTDYSSEGVGNWCLMGGGSWNGNGEIPAHPSAWCKVNQGWISVISPNKNGVYTIQDVKTGRKVYKLWKDGQVGSEYFLLENRRKSLYDRLLPGEGLLIWHVDDSIPTNSDENHPKVALVQADAKNDLEKGSNRGDDGDPFPGNTNNRSLTATSTPNSNSYAHIDTCVAVTDIAISGEDILAQLVVTCPGEQKGLDWKKALQDLYKRLKGILGR
jgi:immune inhibitor A